MKIAAIIVTHNRRSLLINCINAVSNQTKPPAKAYIIDNASTDGTSEMLYEKYSLAPSIDRYINGVLFSYMLLPVNGGGSMGFHEGMKTAFMDSDYDGYWVMDDDGIPAHDCLELLSQHLPIRDYICPVVLDIDNHSQLAFGTHQKYAELLSMGEIIENKANPFNGILYSRRVLREVGFVERDMFIWGDEINYDIRIRKHGMRPCIVTKALHYHTINKATLSRAFFFGKKRVVFVDNKWKMYCRCCNAIYNYRLEGRYIQIMKEFLLYNYFFALSMRSIQWVRLYNMAFINGLRGHFGGQMKYMKK